MTLNGSCQENSTVKLNPSFRQTYAKDWSFSAASRRICATKNPANRLTGIDSNQFSG